MSNEQKPLPVAGWVLVTGHGTAFSFKEPVHPAVPWTELALHAEAQALVDSLTAERDAALEDAKLYRWLRDKANDARFTAPMVFRASYGDGAPRWGDALLGGELDDAVEAAMKVRP